MGTRWHASTLYIRGLIGLFRLDYSNHSATPSVKRTPTTEPLWLSWKTIGEMSTDCSWTVDVHVTTNEQIILHSESDGAKDVALHCKWRDYFETSREQLEEKCSKREQQNRYLHMPRISKSSQRQRPSGSVRDLPEHERCVRRR